MGKKLTQEEFQQRVFNKVGDKYTVISQYQGKRKNVIMHCNKHNCDFEVRAEAFLEGSSFNTKHECPQCLLEHKSIMVTCAYCGKQFTKSPSKLTNSKSGLHFCCREHKDIAQRLDSGKQFADMRPDHYSPVDTNNGSIHTYRDMAFRNYEHKCAICNWNEDVDILQVHHIDENRQNNNLDNLIILCPNCHAKLTSHRYQLINKQNIQRI